AASITFTRSPDGRFSDWHNAPRRQNALCLSGGQVESRMGNGTARRSGRGDGILSADVTGQGHPSRRAGEDTRPPPRPYAAEAWGGGGCCEEARARGKRVGAIEPRAPEVALLVQGEGGVCLPLRFTVPRFTMRRWAVGLLLSSRQGACKGCSQATSR